MKMELGGNLNMQAQTKAKMKTVNMALCALFVALSAVLSQISIPIGTVPVNFTHISIFLSVGLLGTRYGTLSQIVYVILGAIGMPVFSGFTGGLGWVMGATGGFIIGYVVCAFVTGIIIDRFGSSIRVLFLAMYAGWSITYLIGIPWFMIVTGTTSVVAALTACLLPFLLGDLVKTILSAVLINRLRPVLRKQLNNQ